MSVRRRLDRLEKQRSKKAAPTKWPCPHERIEALTAYHLGEGPMPAGYKPHPKLDELEPAFEAAAKWHEEWEANLAAPDSEPLESDACPKSLA